MFYLERIVKQVSNASKDTYNFRLFSNAVEFIVLILIEGDEHLIKEIFAQLPSAQIKPKSPLPRRRIRCKMCR